MSVPLLDRKSVEMRQLSQDDGLEDPYRRRLLEVTGAFIAVSAASALIAACGSPGPEGPEIPGFALAVDAVTRRQGNEVVVVDSLIEDRVRKAKARNAKGLRVDFDGAIADIPHYNWTPTDTIMEVATDYGLEVTALFSFVPPEYRVPLSKDQPAESFYANRPNERGIQVFAEFVAAAIDRYNSGKYSGRKGLKYAEIWNEPNLSPSGASPEEYVVLIKAVNEAVAKLSKARKLAQVAIGGLGPGTNEGIWLAPPKFVQELYNHGLENSDWDALAIHPYSQNLLANVRKIYDWNTLQQIDLTQDSLYWTLYQYTAHHKPFWLTEFGAPTKGPGKLHTLQNPDTDGYNPKTDYVSPAYQLAIVQSVFRHIFKYANVPFDHRFMYTIQDKPGSDSNLNGFGAYYANGQLKWELAS